jgi:hypothetical protein
VSRGAGTEAQSGGKSVHVTSHLESRRTAAPVNLHQITVTDPLVDTRTGQTRATLGQDATVHLTYTHTLYYFA